MTGVLRPADLVDRYDELSELDRSFVDLILLSRQARVIVPHQSAFSRLAGILGDAAMLGFHEAIDAEAVTSRIRRQARFRTRPSGPGARAFWSRDLTWVTDTACDTLGERRLLSIGRRAHRADPTFPAPLLRLALREALRGDADRAARHLDDAKGPSLAPAPHDDPKAAFIATSIGVACVADLGAESLVGPRAATHVLQLREQLAALSQLWPYQMNHAWLLRAASFLVGLRAALCDLDLGSRPRVRRFPVSLAGFRQPRPAYDAQDVFFDPTLRELDRLAFHLSRWAADLPARPPTMSPVTAADAASVAAHDLAWTRVVTAGAAALLVVDDVGIGPRAASPIAAEAASQPSTPTGSQFDLPGPLSPEHHHSRSWGRSE